MLRAACNLLKEPLLTPDPIVHLHAVDPKEEDLLPPSWGRQCKKVDSLPFAVGEERAIDGVPCLAPHPTTVWTSGPKGGA